MKALSKHCRGLSFRMLLLLSLVTLTASCSNVNPLKLLTGSGPNVAANVQAGQTNNQTLGSQTTDTKTFAVEAAEDVSVTTLDQSSGDTKVKSDKVETVIINDTKFWMIILLILGWLAPSPPEIARGIRSLFKLKQ